MGEGARKFGASGILITIVTGLATWFFTIAKGDIPAIYSDIAINKTKIYNNKESLNEIKTDIRIIRNDQKEILRHLIERNK